MWSIWADLWDLLKQKTDRTAKRMLVLMEHMENIPNYSRRLHLMLDELKQEYHYNAQDSVLALRDT